MPLSAARLLTTATSCSVAAMDVTAGRNRGPAEAAARVGWRPSEADGTKPNAGATSASATRTRDRTMTAMVNTHFTLI